MLCLLNSSSTKVRQSIGTKSTFRKISTHYSGYSDINVANKGSSKLLLNDLVAKNLVLKRTRKANKKYQSDHEKLYMRNWTYAASWIKKGKNPFENLESKEPDPPVVGNQGPEDFLVTTGEIGCTRNISIHMPQSYNPLNKNVVQRIDGLLRKYDPGKMINTVNFSGYDGNFCTGLDYGYLFSHRDLPEGKAYLKQVYQMAFTLATMKTPVVTFLDGICLGTGNALFLHAPVRFATDKGLLAIRDIEVGWFPDGGIAHALAQLPNGLGMYLALSGHAVEGADLFYSGLANYWCLSSAVSQVKTAIGKCYSPLPERVAMTVDAAADNPYRQRNFFSEYEANIAKCFTKDTLQGVIEALQQDGGGWALKTLDYMRKSNPVSVAVTFRLIKLAQKLSLEQTIKLEYNIAQQFLKSRDLYEGIERLILNDPAEIPQWQYKSIESVPAVEIDKYFSDKGKDTIELVRMSDTTPHTVINQICQLNRQFRLDKMTKEERQWRSKMSSELLEVAVPYLESVKKETEKLIKNDIGPTFSYVNSQLSLYAQAILQIRTSYNPVAEVTEYLISKNTPQDRVVKELATYRGLVSNTMAQVEYLQELYREFESSKDPNEKAKLKKMEESLEEINRNLTDALKSAEENKQSQFLLNPEIEQFMDLLHDYKRDSLNEKEREILGLMQLEFMVTLSEEELYKRLHDRVFKAHLSEAESVTLSKLFRNAIDTIWEREGFDDNAKEVRDFVKIWKLQIDQNMNEQKQLLQLRRQAISELHQDDQQTAILDLENTQLLQEANARFESEMNTYIYEQLSKLKPKMYSCTPDLYKEYVDSQKEYLQEVQRQTPIIMKEFLEKNTDKIRDIYALHKHRQAKVKEMAFQNKVSNIRSPLAISQVKEQATKLMSSIVDFKGNINLADHVHAVLHLRHAANQELGFVTSNDKLGVYKPASDKEYNELETALRSLIQSIDGLLLKVFNTQERLKEELKKTALPIHYRIVHEYFAPEVVNNPNSLNTILQQKINPLSDLQRMLDRVSAVSKESGRRAMLENHINEFKSLFQSLGFTWLIYRQKLGFGLESFEWNNPEVVSRNLVDFKNGKIDEDTLIDRCGLADTLEHYKQHGFSERDLVRVKETFTRIHKFNFKHSVQSVPSHELTTKFVKHQLDHERLSANQRKAAQTQLKALEAGKSVADSVPYLNPNQKEQPKEIPSDPEWRVKQMSDSIALSRKFTETFTTESVYENIYQIFKARGGSFQKTPITNEEVMADAEKMEKLFDAADDSLERKEALSELLAKTKVGSKKEFERAFHRVKSEVDTQLDSLGVVLGKIGQYYDSTSGDPEERLQAQVQEQVLQGYEQALDPKIKASVEQFRSKMQKIRNDLDREEMEAQKRVSHFSMTTEEFALLLRDVQENSQIPDPSNLKHPKDPIVRLGEGMEGLSLDEMADMEQEFGWQQGVVDDVLREEDKI